MAKKCFEIEIKLRLDAFADYLKLLGYLGNMDSEDTQVNMFYDTEQMALGSAGWAIRVRARSDKGFITVKGISTVWGPAAIREEIQSEITRPQALALIDLQADLMAFDCPPVQFVKDQIGVTELGPLVMFQTLRQCKKMALGEAVYLFELDRTEYADGSVDYELEVELSETEEILAADVCLRKLFGSLNIPFEPLDQSKFARALACATAI